MKNINNKFNYLLILLLSFSSLYLSATSIKIIGEISLFLILFLSMVLLLINLIFIKSISKKELYIIAASFGFLAIMIISALSLNNYLESLYKIGTYIASISLFLYFMISKLSRNQLKILFWNIFVLSLIPFLNFMLGTTYLFTIINPNGIGMLLSFPLFLSILLLGKEKKFLVFSIILIVMIILTVTRSVLLGIFFSMIFYFILKFINNRIAFLVTILISFYVVYKSIIFYTNLKNKEYFTLINNYSTEYAGKNLLSGREEIWKQAFIYIRENLWFGYGIGSNISEIFGMNLSLHNFYIQLTLQSGILGLISFLILLITILNSCYSKNIEFEQKIALSFFIGYLIQQNFEVFLFENNIFFGLLILLTASIGLSASRKIEGSAYYETTIPEFKKRNNKD